MTDPDDIDAALFAAGALSREETEALKARQKGDPALAAKTREWEEALAPLAMHAGEVAPPADLFDRIEARLDAREKLESMSRTLRANEGEWIVLCPGVRFKELHRNVALNRWTLLVDAEPGAVFPEHEHSQDEEIFVISGDLAFDGVELGPGDFHFSPKGSLHAAHRTRAGCRCIIIQAM
ncbi:MAG: cupin domain-containing protein [Methylocystis sp.]|uniref:cupin domain-containing protein n=1 Tax=Methylocystis sp. TaxID=1911079 RepID=UPI0039420085